MEKEYEIPEKLALLADKLMASAGLRDKCIQSPFGFRRARKCAKDFYYFRRKFWRGVFDVYPELEGLKLSYDGDTQKLYLKPPATDRATNDDTNR